MNALKGRIAEALVEGLSRRAQYKVALVGRESRVQRLMKAGPDEFLPDLLVWKPVGSLHRLVAIEVKYRAHIERFQLQDMAKLSKAVEQGRFSTSCPSRITQRMAVRASRPSTSGSTQRTSRRT